MNIGIAKINLDRLSGLMIVLLKIFLAACSVGCGHLTPKTETTPDMVPTSFLVDTPRVDSPTIDMPQNLPICDSLDSLTIIVFVDSLQRFECTNADFERRKLNDADQMIQFIRLQKNLHKIKRICFYVLPSPILQDWETITKRVRKLGIDEVVLTQVADRR